MLAMVNRSEFGNWLQGELDKRGWRQAELARRAGVTRAAISFVMSERRGPGPDLCRSIARAFKIPPEEVFREAGLLPDSKGLSTELAELVHLAALLQGDQLQEVIEIVRLKIDRAEKKKESRIAKAPALGRLIAK